MPRLDPGIEARDLKSLRQLMTQQSAYHAATIVPVPNGKIGPKAAAREPMYTAEQRRRRDESPWTLVQGILAPIQFLVFLVSLGLIARFFWAGEGLMAANISILIKTFALYAIMITGAIWEKEVFGVYLFAKPFFWEDVFSMAVLILHAAYVIALWFDLLPATKLMLLALAAYLTYVINAGQFLWKLRLARLSDPKNNESPLDPADAAGAAA